MPIKGFRKGKASSLLILLFFCLSAGTGLWAEDRIEWQAVEGADHYIIEIRQNNNLVLETRSDNPWMPLFLPPGEYLFQVKVINTFGKTASASEWSPLRITAPVVPFIIDIQPRRVPEGAESTFRVRASGLVAAESETGSTEFFLENIEGNQIPLKTVEVLINDEIDQGKAEGAWDELVLKTDRREPDPGNWSLIMANPDGKQSRIDSVILVTTRYRPKIRKFTPDKIATGETNNIAMLEIDGMEEGAVIEFSGPSVFPTTMLNKDDEGILEYNFNLQTAVPGLYTVIVTNPSGGFDVKEKAFEIVPSPPSAEELAAANAYEIDKREIIPLAEYPNSLRTGWGFSFPVGEASEYFYNDYIEFSFAYSRKISNELIRRLPGFKGMAWDLTFTYGREETTFPIVNINRNQYNILLGLEYVTPFNFPLNLLLRTGAGMGFSIYNSPDYSRDEWIGSFQLEELDTIDFVLRFGAGARVDIGKRWYIDLSCDFTGIFYLSRSAWTVLPRLEGGWRW